MKITHKEGLSKDFNSLINKVNSTQLKVGWSENAKYPDGVRVAVIAAQNEFGNPALKIPPRPFMRPAEIANSTMWKTKMAQGIRQVFNKTKEVGQVFEAIGLLVAGNIKTAIKQVTAPALKTATVKARLRGKKQGKSVSLTAAKPLVDTGYMLNSLTSEVATK